MKKLEIGTYIFKVQDGSMHVIFKDKTEVSLQGIGIEIIGLRKEHKETWSVSLVTDLAIKKLKHGVEKELKLITFDFDTFQEAITCQSFLSLKFFDSVVNTSNFGESNG